MARGRLIAVAGVIFGLGATPAQAKSWNDNAREQIAVRLAAAAADARGARPDEALRKCGEARSYAALHDPDTLIDARIDICFGLAALYRKDRIAACASFARAVALLAGGDPADAMLDLDQAKRAHRELGCR
jgi:hypothetical protein